MTEIHMIAPSRIYLSMCKICFNSDNFPFTKCSENSYCERKSQPCIEGKLKFCNFGFFGIVLFVPMLLLIFLFIFFLPIVVKKFKMPIVPPAPAWGYADTLRAPVRGKGGDRTLRIFHFNWKGWLCPLLPVIHQ